MDGPAAVSSHVSCGQRLWSGGWTLSDRAKKRLLQSNVCLVDILTLRYCFIRDVLLWVGGCMHNKLSPTSLVAKGLHLCLWCLHGMGCNNNDDWVIILRNERRVSSSEVHDKCDSPGRVSLVVTIIVEEGSYGGGYK